MKTKVLSLVVMFVLGTFTVFAGEKTEKFKVKGNCGMCEKRIEKAALSVDGVSKADWNKETKIIAVVLDEEKTDVHKVHMAIAKAGHDTEMHKAKDEVYNELPGCCKYDRIEKNKE
jgi:periplasmic mercuric ion binding protein